jgi:hypothetical protein
MRYLFTGAQKKYKYLYLGKKNNIFGGPLQIVRERFDKDDV